MLDTSLANPASNIRAGRPARNAVPAAGAQRSKHIRSTRGRQRRRLDHQPAADAARSVATILLVQPAWAQGIAIWRLLTMIPGWGIQRAEEHAGALAHKPLEAVGAVSRAQLASRTVRANAHRTSQPRARGPRPPLDRSQEHLRAANRIRIARAAVLAELKHTPAGQAAAQLEALLCQSGRANELDGLAVDRVLKATPGIGKVTARLLLERERLDQTTTLQAIPAPVARRLATAVHKHLSTTRKEAQRDEHRTVLPARVR